VSRRTNATARDYRRHLYDAMREVRAVSDALERLGCTRRVGDELFNAQLESEKLYQSLRRAGRAYAAQCSGEGAVVVDLALYRARRLVASETDLPAT
jgi:hypothetical protein